MGTRYRETERKYDVEPGFRLADLAKVPGVAKVSAPRVATLEAVYYDSDDFRLARRNITLRRRSGGSDDGWHLKLPVAAHVRDEIRRPLSDGDTVPDELADLVQVHLRGAALGPVARLCTTRTTRLLRDGSGEVLVEVVDDAVSAQSPADAPDVTRWREVEVELPAGSSDTGLLDQVGDAVVLAGGRPALAASKLARALGPAARSATSDARSARRPKRGTPAGEVIGAYLRGQWDALLAADPLVRLDEPDSVHKMRVASRRLRSTLRTFEPLFDRDRARELENELRDLATALSGARDTEVLLDHFRGAAARLPADLGQGTVMDRISERLGLEGDRSREEVLAALRGERYPRLVDDLDALIAGDDRPALARGKAGVVLPALVGKADRRLTRRVEAIASAEPGQARDVAHHQARKQAKRLRYAAEAVVAVFPAEARALAGVAEQAQEVLGAHQDATIARDLLLRWGIEARDAGDPAGFAFGVLLGREECRAVAAEQEFAELWKDASRPRYRRWLEP
jgi:CHAD domain-containing protein